MTGVVERGSGRVAKAVEVGSYPTIVLTTFAGFWALTASGLHVTPASYGAGVLAAALVTAHEIKWPHRRQWCPQRHEIRADIAFMVVVQMTLPYLLSIAVTVGIADQLKAGGYTADSLWPHGLPVVVQALLMLLLADLARYWLHRAFHRFGFMWRYHAVHHSPHRLYWLNVGRFHPLEKAVQFAFDALPFVLLGVSREVLGAYFVFYAVNGFFQHSNCAVRLGVLNRIIAGPELHRWHHSEFPEESNNNFGNNLIVWDWIFGTRFFPSGREVGNLGLINRGYPSGFWQQMRTPFVAGLDSETGVRPK